MLLRSRSFNFKVQQVKLILRKKVKLIMNFSNECNKKFFLATKCLTNGDPLVVRVVACSRAMVGCVRSIDSTSCIDSSIALVALVTA